MFRERMNFLKYLMESVAYGPRFSNDLKHGYNYNNVNIEIYRNRITFKGSSIFIDNVLTDLGLKKYVDEDNFDHGYGILTLHVNFSAFIDDYFEIVVNETECMISNLTEKCRIAFACRWDMREAYQAISDAENFVEKS